MPPKLFKNTQVAALVVVAVATATEEMKMKKEKELTYLPLKKENIQKKRTEERHFTRFFFGGK